MAYVPCPSRYGRYTSRDKKTIIAATNAEELSTVLCEAESLINSRPMTYISEDVDDLKVLSPSMFLNEIEEFGVADFEEIDAKRMNTTTPSSIPGPNGKQVPVEQAGPGTTPGTITGKDQQPEKYIVPRGAYSTPGTIPGPNGKEQIPVGPAGPGTTPGSVTGPNGKVQKIILPTTPSSGDETGTAKGTGVTPGNANGELSTPRATTPSSIPGPKGKPVRVVKAGPGTTPGTVTDKEGNPELYVVPEGAYSTPGTIPGPNGKDQIPVGPSGPGTTPGTETDKNKKVVKIVLPSTPSGPKTPGGSSPSGPNVPGGSSPSGPNVPGGSSPSGPKTPGGSSPSGPNVPGGSSPSGPNVLGGSSPSGPNVPGGSSPSGPNVPGGSSPSGPNVPGGSSPSGPKVPGGSSPSGPNVPGGSSPREPKTPGGSSPSGPNLPGGSSPSGPNVPGGSSPSGPTAPEGPDSGENPETPKGPDGKPCSPECLKACKKNLPFIFPGDPHPIFKGGFVGFDKLPPKLLKILKKGSFTYPDLIDSIKELYPKQKELDIDSVPITDMVDENNQFMVPGFFGNYFNLNLVVPFDNPYRIMYYLPEMVHLVPYLPPGALSGTPDNPAFPIQFPQFFAEPSLICDNPQSQENTQASQ
ncbi:hypothetical protein JTE90_020065 [Oedothorax gibbosus]|uniref:Uncharacterized protein n=1 Tax=Oedothorax gibbosus TaxID=931172 RepID=A0AAV6UUJ9_9ARAC|nr:hypothetical protein JTE90_020065 [Oedothorax gibbosus]